MRKLKLTPESRWSGRDYGVVKSFDLNLSTTKPTSSCAWVFAGRTDHFVRFVMRRRICNLGESNERARFGVPLASLRV